MTKKSNLVFLEMTTLFNFIAGNIVHPNAAASFSFGSQYTILAGFIPFIWVTGEARQQDYFVMPVPAGIPYTLRLFVASTGLTLFVGNFSGATDPTNVTAIPPGAISTNLPPPRLVAASPLTANTFVPAPTVGAQKRPLAPGIEYDFIVDGQGRGTVNLRGLAGAVGGCLAGKCAEVSMVNNAAAAGVPVLGAAASDGSFGPLAIAATSGDDLTFLAGTASLAATASLRLVLSQAVSAAELEASLELKDSDATVGVIPFEVVPDTTAPDPSRGFTINPSSAFASGHDITVTLRSDATPRTVPKTLAIKLSAPRTDLIGPRDVTEVNALYLKGGLLLEATNTKLNLYDASDPGNVRACPQALVLRAGLPARMTVHSIRHAYALHLLEGGADIVAVQRLLGHARLATTAIYLKLTKAHLARALAKSHPRG